MVTLVLVKFVGYTSSPAFVIVTNGTGIRIRCLREELFANATHRADEGRHLIIPSSLSETP